jgi:hypothetical protein
LKLFVLGYSIRAGCCRWLPTKNPIVNLPKLSLVYLKLDENLSYAKGTYRFPVAMVSEYQHRLKLFVATSSQSVRFVGESNGVVLTLWFNPIENSKTFLH